MAQVTGARGGALRSVLRFAGAVLSVSGVLMIVDVAVALLWQEPVSAFVADREQGQLEQALRDPPRRVVEREPLRGDAIAKLEIPAIGVSEYVVEGTDTESLRKGPGHYPETPLPGGRGTSAIAGHRTTYGAPFRDLDDLRRGDRIIVDMPDGRYVYAVERTAIVDDQDLSVLDDVGYRRLVLTACHPLYSAEQRVVAFARYVGRGPSRVSERRAGDLRRQRGADRRLVARLEQQDQADHQGERYRDHREPVEDLAEHAHGRRSYEGAGRSQPALNVSPRVAERAE